MTAPPTVAPAPTFPAYASWLRRLLAFVVDSLPTALLVLLGCTLLYMLQRGEKACYQADLDPSSTICVSVLNGVSIGGWISAGVCWLLALAFVVWNYGIRQGRRGSTLGKLLLRFEVVGLATGLPVGVGRSLARQVAHLLDALCCWIGFLWPLWDARRQTFADKITRTACIPYR